MKDKLMFQESDLVLEAILEQFLDWLDAEEPYPILNHGTLVAFVEKYELETETSSENTQRQTEEEWLEENAGIGEEL